MGSLKLAQLYLLVFYLVQNLWVVFLWLAVPNHGEENARFSLQNNNNQSINPLSNQVSLILCFPFNNMVAIRFWMELMLGKAKRAIS